jgi:DinB superfamily
MDQCADCGFVYDLSGSAAVVRGIPERITGVVSILRDRDIDVRSRRRPDVWSPLEYGCHLRDMLLVQRERVLAARRTDRPDCSPLGRDARVLHDGYADQEPEDVARQLADAAQLFDNVFARLSPDDWDRTVVYHYPETCERSLRWVAVHTMHEAQHHLLDIRRQV